MEVRAALEELIRYVQGARAMPMSASCVINRAEMVGMLQELCEALPEDLAQAEDVLAEREELLEEARLSADRLVAEARAAQERMVAAHQVLAEARAQAAALLGAAREEADTLRADADDYVDRTLAHFEVAVGNVLSSVREGRGRLHGATAYDELAPADTVPETRREAPPAQRAARHRPGGSRPGAHRAMPDAAAG